ncbi:hypothetical protein ONZ45_g17440 [Pleurotus djamor]|nr:hypothetical protein ONZ45_g17440 [Pleurotus djamor]
MEDTRSERNGRNDGSDEEESRRTRVEEQPTKHGYLRTRVSVTPLPRSLDVNDKPLLWILDLMHISHRLDDFLSARYLHMNVQPSPTNWSTLYPCAASSS